MRALLLMQAKSPITHGGETAGNEQLIRRQEVSTPVGVRHVPVITGNSIRHRLIREPLAEHIEEACGLTGALSKESLRWLYHGGALDGKHPNVDMRRLKRMQELLPHIEAIGCSMPDTIFPGKLQAGVAWLVCSESRPIVNAITPSDWRDSIPKLSPADEFLGRGQYYRHDSTRRKVESLREADRDDIDNSSMPHAGEHVIPGSVFLSEWVAPGLSELAAGALLFGLKRWASTGSTVGGQSSRGHGVVELLIRSDVDWSLADKYQQHIDNNVHDIREFVINLYKAPEKPKKGKGAAVA